VNPLVYLDYAATAAVRPDAVADAVARFLRENGASPGRAAHRLAVEAGRIALRCRQALARLCGIPGETARIALTFNATHALNAALRGVLRAGDACVVSDLDHNAVLRCAWQLGRERAIEVRHVPASPDGTLDRAAFARAIRGARLVSLNAASNVLGTLLDVPALAAEAHAEGALVLVDAAQIAGHAPFDVAAAGADLVAFTGHKALLGPHGTGALWVRAGVELEPWLAGGTGGDSAARPMPSPLPDRLEAGTLNATGIAGLLAALEWLEARTVAAISADARRHRARMHDGFASIRNVRVHTPAHADGLPIVCITAAGIDTGALAARLDREHGVLTRAGLHCAPEAHRVIGTAQTGAVRFSAGWATSEQDIERAVAAVHTIVNGGAPRSGSAAGARLRA
jgi:cysteine desulfurase / selenocysteine lyase